MDVLGSKEVAVAVVVQVGTIVALVINIILTSKVKRSATQAATDAAVVREETRNSHSPDRPMRHDLDQVMANQEEILRTLDKHADHYKEIQADSAKQWTAVGAAQVVAIEASQTAIKALHAVNQVLATKARKAH